MGNKGSKSKIGVVNIPKNGNIIDDGSTREENNLQIPKYINIFNRNDVVLVSHLDEGEGQKTYEGKFNGRRCVMVTYRVDSMNEEDFEILFPSKRVVEIKHENLLDLIGFVIHHNSRKIGILFEYYEYLPIIQFLRNIRLKKSEFSLSQKSQLILSLARTLILRERLNEKTKGYMGFSSACVDSNRFFIEEVDDGKNENETLFRIKFDHIFLHLKYPYIPPPTRRRLPEDPLLPPEMIQNSEWNPRKTIVFSFGMLAYMILTEETYPYRMYDDSHEHGGGYGPWRYHYSYQLQVATNPDFRPPVDERAIKCILQRKVMKYENNNNNNNNNISNEKKVVLSGEEEEEEEKEDLKNEDDDKKVVNRLLEMIQKCWNHDPEKRPSLEDCVNMLRLRDNNWEEKIMRVMKLDENERRKDLVFVSYNNSSSVIISTENELKKNNCEFLFSIVIGENYTSLVVPKGFSHLL